MKQRWRAGMAVALVLAGGVVARAQDQTQGQTSAAPQISAEDRPTKEQMAKLFEEMRFEKQVDLMMKSMLAMMQKQVAQQVKAVTDQFPEGHKLTQAQQDAFNQIENRYMAKVVGLFPVSEMEDDMTEVYQKHLSRQDVDGLIVFYASPAGQHLLTELPGITQEYMAKIMETSSERSKQLMQEMMADLTKMADEKTSEQPDNSKKN